MPHPTRMHMTPRIKRAIVEVLEPAPSELEHQLVRLSCGHTCWVPGTREQAAYCTLCPPPTRRSFYR